VPNPTLTSPIAQSGTEYLEGDHLGGTRLALSSAGQVVRRWDYLPFGEEIPTGKGGRVADYGPALYPTTPDDVVKKFTSKERDSETGLDFFGARYFSGPQGRFHSPDYTPDGSDPLPIPGADLENPQSLNQYSYVRNSAVTSVDPDGHDCVVQTRTSDTTENVSVSAGNCDNVSIGDGQTKTYVAGTVDMDSIKASDSGGITFGYTPYSGGAGVADLDVAPVPDRPGIAYDWGNNAQAYQRLAAAGKLITNTTLVYAGIYGAIGGAVVGAEIAASTSAARSGIIFRLAHGMRVARGHSLVVAQQGAIKNAIATAIASGAIQKMGSTAFQGVVNVAGTYIKFTGAWTPNGVVVSNVMGAALQK
jgi:RHS repeat-associated protein